MQLELYKIDHGDCPYLPDRNWVTHSFRAESIPESLYEDMLAAGWRRSGTDFYQNHCPECECCTPTRVPVRRFRPSSSQRRVLRRNADVTLEVVDPSADDETLELYQRYVRARHTPVAPDPGEEMTGAQLERFLVRSAVDTRAMQYRVSGKLVGVGWVDNLPDGLSSVYFAFDPDEGRRSLGTYSLLCEIDLARSLGRRWLYLGFYVPGSPKMEYKGAFRPREFAVRGRWTRDEGELRC